MVQGNDTDILQHKSGVSRGITVQHAITVLAKRCDGNYRKYCSKCPGPGGLAMVEPSQLSIAFLW